MSLVLRMGIYVVEENQLSLFIRKFAGKIPYAN